MQTVIPMADIIIAVRRDIYTGEAMIIVIISTGPIWDEYTIRKENITNGAEIPITGDIITKITSPLLLT